MTDNVIDPRRLHRDQECSGDLGRLIARACFVFDTGEWRRRWREAREAKDHDALDRLDRQFEMIGLP